MKKILNIFLYILPYYLYSSDTLKIRVLYHPRLNLNYSIHKSIMPNYRYSEYFYRISNNQIQMPGYTLHDSLLYNRIRAIFDSTKCNDSNKVVYYSKKTSKKIFHPKYEGNKLIRSKDYYIGLVFYAFDITCVLDSFRYPITLLDFNEFGEVKIKIDNKEIKAPMIVTFIEITPIKLKKHKLKKNGKIYPLSLTSFE